MGLDQTVYKITKPTGLDTNFIHDFSEINSRYLTFPCDKIKEYNMDSLIPYCIEIKANTKTMNYKQMCKDYGLDRNKAYASYSNGNIYTYTDNNKSIDISAKTIEEKYTHTEIINYYVCEYEEEIYWRKEYDIQKWFHEHLGRYYETNIENCGYYIIPEFLIKQFNKDQIDHPFESYKYTNKFEMLPVNTTTATSALAYFEWY